MKAHPVAELFPMMTDEELADLAADIKANGLNYPIIKDVVDGEETLIDSRNRAADAGDAAANGTVSRDGKQSRPDATAATAGGDAGAVAQQPAAAAAAAAA